MVQIRHFSEAERKEASVVIEAKVMKLAAAYNVSVDKLVWNLEMGMNHAGPHRLDVHIDDHILRIYFTDHELAAYWGEQKEMIDDNRLHALMARVGDILLARDTQEPQSDHPDRMGQEEQEKYCHAKGRARRYYH